ncbi:hypothetical protein D6789_03360 [Candidatus Woesearchaeota archaeon]|nr:MAG: hypothetical protein D6789_03360 [Candidatus Woesearchaeota archaeon]
MKLYKILAKHYPDLKLKLLQARMPETPDQYIRRQLIGAVLLAAMLALLFTIFSQSLLPGIVVFLIAAPILLAYLMSYVDMRIRRLNADISREVVYAGRFLIIELESGVPLYQTFQNLAKNYEAIGVYFREILERVDLGTSMEDALNETITTTPSPELRKMLWQLLNSIKTGSEVSDALNAVFDQIVREQQIAVSEYGRKLNPMAMFYMMIAVIVPSLGTIMLVVLTSFMDFPLPFFAYVLIAAFVGFIQFMFLAMIKSNRPPTEF